jgi:hypothetical protein
VVLQMWCSADVKASWFCSDSAPGPNRAYISIYLSIYTCIYIYMYL